MFSFGVMSPGVLTESIFSTYGGYTGTATAAQLNGAFCIGEQRAQTELGTFLVPTSVTGTFLSAMALIGPFALDCTRIHSVDEAILFCENHYSETLRECTSYARIKEPTAGVVELRVSPGYCGSCGICGVPLMFRINYTAGLPAGVSAGTPAILNAVTIAADLALQQMVDPSASEGGPGDPGVQQWGSFSYRETRTPLRRTGIGSSARANYAAELLRPWKVIRPLKLGWG